MKKIILLGIICTCLIGCIADNKLDVSKHMYKVSKSVHYGYILGTNHSAKKYSALDDYTEKAYEESNRLILEISMDSYESQKNIEKTKINSVKTTFTDEQMKKFDKLKNKYNILKRSDIKEYNIAAISSLCTEEIANKEGYNSQNSPDLYLYNKAISNNKTFVQLEDQNSQYELLASLSKEVPDYYLDELSKIDHYTKEINDFNANYYNANKKQWKKYMKGYLQGKDFSENKLYVLDKIGTERNIKMVEKLDMYFQEDVISFVAVGVSHVEGDNGILKLLEEKGYHVEYVKK